MSHWRGGLLLAGLLGLSGCNRFAPEEYAPFSPPPEYAAWWAKNVACAGRAGDFARIRWFVVPGDDFECPTGRCVGRWEDDHRIYLAQSWRENEMVVRHEMLHELLNRSGHPSPPFGSPCPLTWATWNGGAALRADGSGTPPLD